MGEKNILFSIKWRELLIKEIIGCILYFIISTVLTTLIAFSRCELNDFFLIIILIIRFLLVIRIVKKYCKLRSQYEKAGVLEIIQQRDETNKNNPKMTKKLESAKEIRIFVTTGKKFFTSNKEAIERAIKKNHAKVYVLIANNKKGSFLTDIEELEVKAKKRAPNMKIKKEILETKSILNEINQNTNNKVPIEIKYFNTEFRVSMIITKNAPNLEWGWVTLTLPPYKAVDTISFEIESKNTEEDNIFNQCKTHFDAVWEKIP